MTINKETAQYVAELSRLKIKDEEIESVCNELSSILNYMDEINATIDTDTAPDTSYDLCNVMRDDIIHDSFAREILLENAPEHTEETPIVPKTVD